MSSHWPWRRSPDYWWLITDADGHEVADVAGNLSDSAPEDSDLITSAPELRNALADLVVLIRSGQDWDQTAFADRVAELLDKIKP